jgi:dihydrodipicolinate synthase/N-acetylneuraminate lyase
MAVKPGSMVALVTPMKPDGAIDEQQLRDILRWHVACETDGVVVLGTTGEVRVCVWFVVGRSSLWSRAAYVCFVSI